MRPRLVVGNAVGVTTGETIGERVLRSAARVPGAAVIVLVEADDVSAVDGPVLDPAVWRVFHREHDREKDGTLVAYRRDVARHLRAPRWRVLVPEDLPYAPRAPFDTRWCLEVPLVLEEYGRRERVVTVMGGHLPPPRSPGQYVTRAVQTIHGHTPDVFAGDLNLTHRQARARFPGWRVRVPRGDVIGAVAPRGGARLGRAAPVRLSGSDHTGAVMVL